MLRAGEDVRTRMSVRSSGITTYVEQAQWGDWQLDAALIPYSTCSRSSAPARCRCSCRRSTAGWRRRSTRSTGSLLTGGSDLDPELVRRRGASRDDRDAAGARPRRARAARGRARARHAGARHLPRHPGAERRPRRRPRASTCPRSSGTRRTARCRASSPSIPCGSRTARSSASLLGERTPVKSHHHQGFGTVGEGLARGRAGPTTARSRRSRIPSKRFALGVLWHPEAGDDARLFEALVAEARAYRAERRA